MDLVFVSSIASDSEAPKFNYGEGLTSPGAHPLLSGNKPNAREVVSAV